MGRNVEIVSCNSGEENMEGQDIELYCNNIILLQRSSVQHCKGMEYLNNFAEYCHVPDPSTGKEDATKHQHSGN